MVEELIREGGVNVLVEVYRPTYWGVTMGAVIE